jgi:4-hydroxy-tetrahydrodipicolinate synthase
MTAGYSPGFRVEERSAMKEIGLKGMVPAAILPMNSHYEPQYDAYAGYLEWLIQEKAVAIAVNMDTGEGPQLTIAERRRAVETAVRVAGGRCAIVAGVMGSTTGAAVEMALVYQDAGADGLVVFPNAAFRNEPLDPRIPYDYHQAIARATGMPLVLFQLAPVFGGTNYSREVLLRLLEIPEVIGIKEASFDAQFFAFTMDTLRLSGRDLAVLTGNDRFITESILLGANGALLGFGAIGCRMVAEMLACFAGAHHREGVAMRPRVQGFADFIYQDPVLDYRARCKAALAHIGVIDRSEIYVRPPLFPIEGEEYEAVGRALITAGMLAGEMA